MKVVIGPLVYNSTIDQKLEEIHDFKDGLLETVVNDKLRYTVEVSTEHQHQPWIRPDEIEAQL